MNPKFAALAVSAVALAAAIGFAVYTLVVGGGGRQLAAVSAVSVGGPFTLTDHNGNETTDKNYHGKYILVQFGYTYCPDICPTELQKAATTLDLLGEDADEVQVLFISVDPERDTAAILADYVGAFHENIIGLTGTPDQIRNVTKAYRVYYAKDRPDENGDYLVSHSAFTYFMSPDGQYLRHFSSTDAPEVMAEQIRAAL